MHELNNRLAHMLRSIGFEYAITDELIKILIINGLEFTTNDNSVLHVILKDDELYIKGSTFLIRESKMKKTSTNQNQHNNLSAAAPAVNALPEPMLDSELFQQTIDDKMEITDATIEPDTIANTGNQSILARFKKLLRLR